MHVDSMNIDGKCIIHRTESGSMTSSDLRMSFHVLQITLVRIPRKLQAPSMQLITRANHDACRIFIEMKVKDVGCHVDGLWQTELWSQKPYKIMTW